jgi:hypothetical protein
VRKGGLVDEAQVALCNPALAAYTAEEEGSNSSSRSSSISIRTMIPAATCTALAVIRLAFVFAALSLDSKRATNLVLWQPANKLASSTRLTDNAQHHSALKAEL